MTYPEPAVAGTINNSDVPLQINTKESAAKSIVERFRHVWTPDVRLLDADGFEYYRWNGFLLPFEYLRQKLVAETHARLRQKKVEAAELYNNVVELFQRAASQQEADIYIEQSINALEDALAAVDRNTEKPSISKRK